MSRSRSFALCCFFMMGLTQRDARAEDGEVSASIVNVFPQGRHSVLVLNRGLRAGAKVGQVARCAGPPAFTCRLIESYEFRSKCVVELDSHDLGLKGPCRVGPPGPFRAAARILEVVPEGETTTFVFDKGHAHGVRMDDWAELDGRRCRIWRLENERAACALEAAPASAPTHLTVVSAFMAGVGALEEPLIAPPPVPAPERPARGAQERARPVAIARAHGHGLVAAQPCLGFTPDERAAFVLSPGPIGLPPWPGERGLELWRVDLATGASTIVHTFEPARVLEARRLLAELVTREGLLACHAAASVERSTAGDRGLVAHHRLDRILFWSADDVVYAAMEGGAGLAERVGRGALDAVWFVPGFARHLGQAADRWQVLEVR